MASRFFSSVRRRAALALPLTAALLAAHCSFTPDDVTLFTQAPVPTVKMHTQIEREIGAPDVTHPMFAVVYQLYYAQPASTAWAPIVTIDQFPALIATRFSDVLPASLLNRGFALGYGNYVLAVAFLAAFDDLNDDGIFTDGEPVVGASTEDALVYFQGTLTQEVVDQFGSLAQGYNVCRKVAQYGGIDLFREAPSSYTATVTIHKAGTPVKFPVLK